MKIDVINKTEDTVTISKADFEALTKKVSTLEEEVESITRLNEWLTEQMRVNSSRKFGSNSEKASDEVIEQLSFLFNEPETYAHIEELEESTETAVSAHTRKKIHTGNVLDIVPKDMPVNVEEHHLTEEELICGRCGSRMEEIGSTVRRTLVIEPPKVYVKEDRYYTAECRNCIEQLDEEGKTHTQFRKAEPDPALIPGGYASAESVAYLMTQKYVMGSPLYRIEQELNRQNVMLTRQTMSNWMISCSERYLKPLYDALKESLIQEDIIHADETTLQVLREPGKKPESESYMWLYRTGRDTARPAVLYEYCDSRAGRNAERFLKGFHGYLQTDGYQGYNMVENVTHVGCWAHARRKFEDAVRALPQGKKAGAAIEGEAYCTRIFEIEKKIKDLTPEERYAERLRQAKPVLDAFFAWAKTRNASQKTKLGIALTYVKNQEVNLRNYLLDGKLEVSNNIAERSIKPFVIDRKNFLFANTPAGATASAVTFSIIETAKANGLNPYEYLLKIFKEAPYLSSEDPDWAKKLLPF